MQVVGITEINETEADQVQGGVFINPWTAMIAVRVVQIATPYVQAGVIGAVSAGAGALGYNVATM